MKATLRQRLRRGIGAQGYARAVNVLYQVATVPLLISAWGVELYGEWLILSAIPAYLAMSDVGFTTAAQNEMTMAIGRGDRGSALNSFQSAWLLVVALSLAVVAAVIAAMFAAPFDQWLNLKILPPETARWVLMLLSVQIVVGLQSRMMYSGFHCVGSYGLGQFLSANIRLLQLGLLAIIIIVQGGLVAAAAALATGEGLGAVVMRAFLWRVNPDISFGRRHAQLATIKRLAGPALAFAAFPMSNALNVQGMVLVVAALFGPAAVTVFSTLRTLTRFGLQLVGAIFGMIHAEISTAYGANDTGLLRQLHDRACQAALWLTFCVAFGLGVLGEWLLHIWTNGEVTMDRDLFTVLLALVIVTSLWQVSMMLAYATNRHQRGAIAYLLISLLAIPIAYGVAQMLGLVGVAVTLVVVESFLVGYVVHMSLDFLRETPLSFVRIVIRPPLFVFKLFR